MSHRWITAVFLSLLAAGSCKSVGTHQALPVQHSIVRDQLVIYSDFPLPEHHRLIDELAAQRHDLSEKLQLPLTSEPIHVYLFSSASTFREFISRHYPNFPARRAFFVESDTRLAVYAHWGDRVAEDLRHEVAHGYLHAAVPRLPLWIDEGLAEYFEVPRGQRGLNQPHVVELFTQIKHHGWRPNLKRLEAIDSVADMSQLDYAEAWAWAYYLLETTPQHREVLHQYLHALREQGTAPPLSEALSKLYAEPEQKLYEFLIEKGR